MPDKTNGDGQIETKRGYIRHRHRKMSKGIEMLRLERKLAPILDRWRAAVKANPTAWK
jgi:hypothetical protein